MSQREIGLNFIENLRQRKERIKKSILFLNNEITNIDIEIREIRQHLPREEIKQKENKPIETLAQKYKRLQRELAEMDMLLGVNK